MEADKDDGGAARPSVSPTAATSQAPGGDFSFEEFTAWAHRQARLIADRSGADIHSELFLYTQAAKLVEEMGELHAELLGRSKLQRREKNQEFSRATLEGEFADVLICTAILARVAGVDLREALWTKMNAVDARIATGNGAGEVDL